MERLRKPHRDHVMGEAKVIWILIAPLTRRNIYSWRNSSEEVSEVNDCSLIELYIDYALLFHSFPTEIFDGRQNAIRILSYILATYRVYMGH